jgi:hypothetical protein
MATEQQIAANRLNAQLSTGPSEAGKKISRMNAWRHGLTGQFDIRTPEEQEAHDTFCDSIVSSLAPAEGIERQFAQSVAEDHWRLNRARCMENNFFALARSFQAADDIDIAETPEVRLALADARAFVDTPTRFQLLTTYERRIHGNMSKSLKQLTDLKTARLALEAREKAEAKAQRDQALEQARLLTQLAEMEGEPCDIATEYPQIGFVFSDAEIAQAIYFAGCLKAAKRAESANWKISIRLAA